MPRVVGDQKTKFETDEIFKKLSQEMDVKYTGARDKSMEERKERFMEELKQGHSVITFVATGTNLTLQFIPRGLYNEKVESGPSKEFVDFDRDQGKVHLQSSLIMNGVCVKWIGCIDLDALCGKAYLAFDEDRARLEDKVMRDSLESAQERQRQFEERLWQEQQNRRPEQNIVTSPGTS